MHRREPDRTVNPYLAHALVNGTEHRIQHNQRGDENRHKQIAHPTETCHPDTAIEIGILVAPDKEVQRDTVHQRCHNQVQLVNRAEQLRIFVSRFHIDGDAAEGAALVHDYLVRQNRDAVGSEMQIFLQFAFQRLVTGCTAAPLLLHELVVNRGELLAIVIGEVLEADA